jgi:hypothetical protein
MIYELHVSSTESESFKDQINTWFLDSPINSTSYTSNSSIQIKGWVLSKNSEDSVFLILENDELRVRHEVSLPRPDVIEEVLGQEITSDRFLNCGFDFGFPSLSGTIVISFEINGAINSVRTISINQASNVLVGIRNWLFLDNDSNRSVDQYCGELSISEDELDRWHQYLKSTHSMISDIESQWVLIIAPSKEYVVPQYFPYKRGENSTADQLLAECEKFNAPVLYPLEILNSESELTYTKGDTHWTDYGALIACNEIVRFFGIETLEASQIPYFQITKRLGDLGIKLNPPQYHTEFVANFSSKGSILSFDNGIHNHGRIWIFENCSAKLKSTAVIFGGSSSNNMAQWLSLFFSRLVFVHTAGGIDESVLLQEKPDYVIAQTNARFTITAPPTSVDVKEIIRDKISRMNNIDRESLERHLNVQGESLYATWGK